MNNAMIRYILGQVLRKDCVAQRVVWHTMLRKAEWL